MEMLTEGMNFEFCDLEKVPERSFVAVRKSARSSRKVLKQLPILLNEDQQQHLSTRTNWRKNNFLNEQRHFQKNEQDFQVVEKSAPGQIPHILQEMKENMDVITDKDIQDLDKSKSEKQSGNAEISAQIERHMEHKSVKSNVLPSDKRASIVGDDHSCVSTVASVKNSEYLVTEDKYSHPADKSFSTPKKCSDFPCDSEQLITEASKEVLKSPIDFTTVTVADFGITPEIFTIKSSGNANKSLQKARRRSTIGVRGSPETNFLIRYIAQQRSNSKKESVAQVSPYRCPIIKSPYSSSFKKKISVFRSSFQSLEENDENINVLEFPEEEREYVVTKKSKSPFKKQNSKTQLNGEPSSKRKRLVEGDISLTSSEDKETLSSIHLSGDLLCGDKEGTVCTETAEEISKGDCFDSSLGKTSCSRYSVSGFASDLLAVEGRDGEKEIVNYGTLKESGRKLVKFADLVLPLKKEASLCPIQVQDGRFLRPVLKKTPSKDCSLESQEHNLLAEDTGFLESEVTKAVLSEETENTGNSNKKRVTFGRDLSPEVFDRSLPPNTPLRKGGTPGSRIESRTTSPSSLEAGISLSPFCQPNFDECIEPCVDPFEDGLPSGSPSSSDTFSGAVPSASDTTFEETSLTNIRTTRSSTKKKCADFVKKTHDCDTSTSKLKYTKQQNFKDKPQTKSTRPVNKNTQVIKGKGKGARGKRGKKKMVPKPLYGDRELASKKPLLSPIVELPETSGTPSSSASWRLSQGGNLGARETCKEPVEDDSRKKNTGKNSIGKIIIGTEGYLFDMSEDEQVADRYEERQDPRRKTSVKECIMVVEDTQADECNTLEFNSNRTSFHFPTINSTTSGPKSVVMNMLEQAGNIGNDANSTAVQNKTEEHSNIKLPREDITSYSDTAVIQRRHSKRGKCRRHSLRLSERRSLTVKHISRANARDVSVHLPTLVNQNTDHFLLATTKKTEDALDMSSLKEKYTSSDATMGCTPNQILSASSTKVLCPKIEEHGRCEGGNSCYNRDCILPVLTESSAKEKAKIQSKARRNTIFCPFPEVDISEGTLVSPERNSHGFHSDRPVLPSIAPSKNDPEANASDHSFCIEEVLGSVASGDRKKVRRSARLYRSSGISGLTWVETSPQSHKDIAPSSLKSRRKTMSISALKINKNSPQSWKNNMKFSMPDKENCENVPVLFSFNKSRQRRSMCALTVQDTGASKFQKSRRSFSYKSTTTCKPDVDKKDLLAEREIND